MKNWYNFFLIPLLILIYIRFSDEIAKYIDLLLLSNLLLGVYIQFFVQTWKTCPLFDLKEEFFILILIIATLYNIINYPFSIVLLILGYVGAYFYPDYNNKK